MKARPRIIKIIPKTVFNIKRAPLKKDIDIANQTEDAIIIEKLNNN